MDIYEFNRKEVVNLARNILDGNKVSYNKKQNLLTKIKNRQNEGLPFSEEKILKDLEESNLYALHLFAINPSRQNIDEKRQINFLNTKFNIDLKKDKNKDYYLIDNNLYELPKGKSKKDNNIPYEERSIDAINLNFGQKPDIAFCKCSKSQGGGQNHQRDDVLRFIKKCIDNKQKYGTESCFYKAYIIVYHQAKEYLELVPENLKWCIIVVDEQDS